MKLSLSESAQTNHLKGNIPNVKKSRVLVCLSVSQSKKSKETNDGQTDGPEKVLRKIDWGYLEQKNIVSDFNENVQRAITLLWYADHYETEGSTLPQSTVHGFLLKLNHLCIEFAHNQFVEYSRRGITNQKAYLKSIVFNSVFEGLFVKADANFKLFGNGMKEETALR